MNEVEKVVSAFRDQLQRVEGVELEMRLGHGDATGKFSPGVTKDIFKDLLSDLSDNPSLQSDRNWSELVDYYYVTTNGEMMRTRVEYDTSNMVVSTAHCMKENLTKALIRHPEESDGEVCRLSLSVEHPVMNPPEACVPTHVRVQQRRRFVDVRDDNVIWSYELSKTWSAPSRTSVEQKQHMCEPIYEVECELVDSKRRYMTESSDEYVGQSLLMKASLLLGHDAMKDMLVDQVVVKESRSVGMRTKSSRVRGRGRKRK